MISRRAAVWWTVTIIVAAFLFFVALSDAIYNFTSPPGAFQILLRKSYSIVAFAVVGYLYSRALRASAKPMSLLYVATAVAIYSASIEIGQDLIGSHEGLIWNAIDTACGFVGGLLGNLVAPRTQP